MVLLILSICRNRQNRQNVVDSFFESTKSTNRPNCRQIENTVDNFFDDVDKIDKNFVDVVKIVKILPMSTKSTKILSTSTKCFCLPNQDLSRGNNFLQKNHTVQYPFWLRMRLLNIFEYCMFRSTQRLIEYVP
jgi:hypothetical protein